MPLLLLLPLPLNLMPPPLLRPLVPQVQKKNTERVRRARISSRIAQLHDLARAMVGEDVSWRQ